MKTDNTWTDEYLWNNDSKMEDEFDDCTDRKVNETVIGGGYIKQEPCDSEDQLGTVQNNVDVKEETIDVTTAVAQETGFVTNTKERIIRCKGCGEEYDLYCLECPMLIRIFDSNKPNGSNNVRWTLPQGFIDICKTPSGVGIVALRAIPRGVVFGPFEGLNSIKDDAVSKWKLKNKELAYTKDPKRLNWMQYIRKADESSHPNLIPFQYEDGLYYRSDCHISVGDELLVCWEETAIQDIKDSYFEPQLYERLDNTYACSLCCVGYKSIGDLTAHNSRCAKKGNRKDFCIEIIQCVFCKIYLDEKEYSDYHMDGCGASYSEKYVETPRFPEDIDRLKLKDEYRCSMCEYSTSRKDNLGRHQLTHTDVRMYKCSECPHRTRTNSQLKKHLRTHANCSRTRFECQLCGERFFRSDIFAMHQKKKHSVSVYKCDKCVFETTNSKYLRSHLATHEDVKSYSCNACNKQFKLRWSLLEHVRKLHDEKKKKYKCPKCDFKTIHRGSITQHLVTVHSGVKRFKCSKCAFKSRYKGDLELHLHYHEDVKPMKCENCDSEFWSTPLLLRHEKEVHRIGRDGPKLFPCTFCPYKTKYVATLKHHIAAHNDERPFKCDTCAQTFRRKPHLKRHVRAMHSETEERQYKCSECPFETNHQTSFNFHVDAHNKSELFQCTKCDYNTYRKDNFRTHQKRHERTEKENNKVLDGQERLKSLDCPMCGMIFCNKGRLTTHLKRLHASKVKEEKSSIKTSV